MYSEKKNCLNNKNGECTWLKGKICEGFICDVKIDEISKNCPHRFNTTMSISCNIYFKPPLNWDRDQCINHPDCKYKIQHPRIPR